MLRITDGPSDGTGSRLHVEGRIAGRWVTELGRATEEARACASHLVLDLSQVTYVDQEGVRLLRMLRDSGVDLVACSTFVTSLLSGGAK